MPFVRTILADDTSDRSKNELTSVCVRYVMENKEFKAPESANCTWHKYSIHEDPIQIIDLIPRIRDLIQAKTEDEVAMSGENIGRVLVWVVKALGLDFDKCVGQGYDGCSTMSSDRVGAAATFKEEAVFADYYHCVMHKLNLSASTVIKDLNIQFAHAGIKKIAKFFNSSPKRAELLKKVIQDAEDTRISKSRFQNLCETRFLERHTAVDTLRKNLPYVLTTFNLIQEWKNSQARSGALNLECMIERQQFISSLVMLEHVTGVLRPLTEQLQKV